MKGNHHWHSILKRIKYQKKMSVTFHGVQLQAFSSHFHVLIELHIQLCLIQNK